MHGWRAAAGLRRDELVTLVEPLGEWRVVCRTARREPRQIKVNETTGRGWARFAGKVSERNSERFAEYRQRPKGIRAIKLDGHDVTHARPAKHFHGEPLAERGRAPYSRSPDERGTRQRSPSDARIGLLAEKS